MHLLVGRKPFPQLSLLLAYSFTKATPNGTGGSETVLLTKYTFSES